MIDAIVQFSDDVRWAFSVMRARRWRRDKSISRRAYFDHVMRPSIPGEIGSVIAYPDAFYCATPEDVDCAMGLTELVGGIQAIT